MMRRLGESVRRVGERRRPEPAGTSPVDSARLGAEERAKGQREGDAPEEGVDPEPGEVLGDADPAPVTAEEAERIEAKDLIENARTEDDWAALAAWAGPNERLWVALAERAPSIAALEQLQFAAQRAGMLTARVVSVAAATTRELRRRNDLRGQ